MADSVISRDWLTPGVDNLVTDDGYRSWSSGAMNCKKNVYRVNDVFSSHQGKRRWFCGWPGW